MTQTTGCRGAPIHLIYRSLPLLACLLRSDNDSNRKSESGKSRDEKPLDMDQCEVSGIDRLWYVLYGSLDKTIGCSHTMVVPTTIP